MMVVGEVEKLGAAANGVTWEMNVHSSGHGENGTVMEKK